MANLATVLKSEIARVARKEARAEVEPLRKANAQYRSAIAQLRRQISGLEKQLKQAKRRVSAAAPTVEPPGTARRFSASRLAAHRTKVGLSAAAYGKLVGMSGATIYLWEQGKSRPSAEQLTKLAALRSLRKQAIGERQGAT